MSNSDSSSSYQLRPMKPGSRPKLQLDLSFLDKKKDGTDSTSEPRDRRRGARAKRRSSSDSDYIYEYEYESDGGMNPPALNFAAPSRNSRDPYANSAMFYSPSSREKVMRLQAQESRFLQIAKDFPEFSPDQVSDFIVRFQNEGTDDKGTLSKEQIGRMLRNLGEEISDSEIDRLIKDIDEDGSGTIDFTEFLHMLRKFKSTGTGKLSKMYSNLLSNQKSWRHLFKNVTARPSTDSVLRVSVQRLLQHYMMCDHKANVLITVCAIILSFAINLVNKGDVGYSLIAFSLTTVLALFFAVGAVIPRYHRSTQVSSSNSKIRNFNVLYFEDSSRIPMDTYMGMMADILARDDTLYSEMVKDLYLMGINLSVNKYQWIRRSYLTFAWGTVATIIVFALSVYFKWDAKTWLKTA